MELAFTDLRMLTYQFDSDELRYVACRDVENLANFKTSEKLQVLRIKASDVLLKFVNNHLEQFAFICNEEYYFLINLNRIIRIEFFGHFTEITFDNHDQLSIASLISTPTIYQTINRAYETWQSREICTVS